MNHRQQDYRPLFCYVLTCIDFAGLTGYADNLPPHSVSNWISILIIRL